MIRVMMTFWSEAVVIAVALSLWVPRFSGSIDLRWDGSVYYLLARLSQAVMATG